MNFKTQLSPAVQNALMQHAADADSGVRMDKVLALQAAIASGTYRVDAGAVADKIIASLMVY